jgi:hypothetical protein
MAVNETVGINLVADTKSLRSQLKEAIAELANLQNKAGASAKEIANAAKRAAELKDRIGDAKDTIAAFNPDAKFKAFSQSIQGVAGAFAGAQGAFALFGIESENVQKQLLKVQAALALSEGLNTVIGSIDGFKNLALVLKTQVVGAFSTLRGAIVATGIGALAIALGFLVSNFEDVKKAIFNLIPGLSKMTDYVGELVTKMTDFVGITSEAERAVDKLGKTTKNRNAQLENEIKLLEASGSTSGAIGQKKREIIDNEIQLLKEKGRVNGKLTDEELQKIQDLQYQKKVLDINDKTEAQKRNDEHLKKLTDQALKEAEAKADKEIALEQERAKRLFEIGKIGSPEYEQKLADLTLQYQNDLKLFEDNESAKISITRKYQEQAFELWKANRDILTAEEEKQVDDRFNKLDKQATKEIAERNKTNNLISKAMDNNIKKVAENEVKVDRAAKMAKLGIAADALGALSGMAEQGSALQKGLALGQIAVDTAMAISSLTANSEANPGNAVSFGGAGIAQFATGILRILANIAQAKTIIEQVPGGSGQSIPMPSISQPTAPVEPTYTAVQATQLNSTSLNAIQNVVARAYVVESDISNSQTRIQRIQNAARF